MVPLLPVTVQTLRKSGNIVEYNGWYPISNLPQDIDRALLRAQNTGEGQAAVKQRVLTWLKDNGVGQFPDGENLSVIAQESDQRLKEKRPGVDWRYNALETEVDGAQTRESVTIQQPLFNPVPSKYSSLLRFGR